MPANPSAGIGFQRHSSYVKQQQTRASSAASSTPVTRVVATSTEGKITDPKTQLRMGSMYGNTRNSGMVSRFDRARDAVNQRVYTGGVIGKSGWSTNLNGNLVYSRVGVPKL